MRRWLRTCVDGVLRRGLRGAITIVGTGALIGAGQLAVVDVTLAGEGARVRPGQPAPNFLLPLMNSTSRRQRTFRLRDYVGTASADSDRRAAGAVVLSFAASYCEPCRGELAELRRRAEDFANAGATVAIVVIDTEEDGIEAMRQLTVDRLQLPFAVLADRFGVLARRYGATTLPMSVVVDGAGVVRLVQSGFHEDTVDRLLAAAGQSSGRRPQGRRNNAVRRRPVRSAGAPAP